MALRQITQEDVDNRLLSHSHPGYASNYYDEEERENFRPPRTENSLSGLPPWEEILQSDSPDATSYYDDETASYYDDETAFYYDDETDNSASGLSSLSQLRNRLQQNVQSFLRNASMDQLLSFAVYLGDYRDPLGANRAANERDGLTEEIISQCVKSRRCHDGDIMDICVVCQSEYKKGEMLATLECGHEYHGSCIRRWLMEKDSCPVCKRKASGHHPHGSR